MNSFRKKYEGLKEDILDLVYGDIVEFVKNNKNEVSDWSDLAFETFDHRSKKYLKFGKKITWGVPAIDEHYNKDREEVKSISFLFEEDFDTMWVGVVVNGKVIMPLDEDSKVDIAGYIEDWFYKETEKNEQG